MEYGGEAEAGVVVAGCLVRAHRDPAPLLELVEAVLHDVSTAVAHALLIAEVDRPSGALAAVRDLVIAFGDGPSDPALA